MFDVHVEFPSQHLPPLVRRSGYSHKWAALQPTSDLLIFPRIEPEGSLFLFTRNGEYYDILLINADTTLFKFGTFPFTHWFTKPISPRSRFRNHDRPILMDDGVDYLVDIHGRLNFISTETLLRDALPISTWYGDKDLFPIK